MWAFIGNVLSALAALFGFQRSGAQEQQLKDKTNDINAIQNAKDASGSVSNDDVSKRLQSEYQRD